MGDRLLSFETLVDTVVDANEFVLRGVAVITEGPALGHGLMVDATTLEQVKVCAETYKNGLKVKMDHGGGAGDIVGYLRNFTVEGTVLRADLYILKTSPHRDYILEIAESIPDTFGLSVSFSGVPEDNLARCAEIYSADIVSEPAANPNGLFEQRKMAEDQPTPDMTPEEINAALTAGIDAACAPLLERLAKLETIVIPVEPEKEEPEEMAEGDPEVKKEEMSDNSEAIKLAAQEAALAVVREFRASLPTPAKASAEAKPEAAPEAKSFEALVKDALAAGAKRNEAVDSVMKSHPAEYQAYRRRCEQGEIILF